MNQNKTKSCPRCSGTGQVQDDAALGAELRQLRVAACVSLWQVASQMGFSVSYISDLEHGRKAWTITKIEHYRRSIGLPA